MATCHGKERSVSLPFRRLHGVDVRLCSGLETDRLGTFCGEVERPGPPKQVVVQKAQLALVHHPEDLALATEGTFAPHPHCPWVPWHREVMVVVDGRRGHQWWEEEVTSETNHRGATVQNLDELREFLGQVGFPQHRVMVQQGDFWLKGLGADWDLDRVAFPCRVETDMRAHCNPKRRAVIRRLALRLAQRWRNPCPACGELGFGRVGWRYGLVCSQCQRPSEWVKAEIVGCQSCQWQEDRPRPDGLQALSPAHCPYCNP